MSPCARAGLDTLRGSRRSLAWLFCGLLLVVCGERRLADYRYSLYNLTLHEIGIKSAESLDGNEVALRLLVADDASPAVLAAAPRRVPQRLVIPSVETPVTRAVALPHLRAPPVPAIA